MINQFNTMKTSVPFFLTAILFTLSGLAQTPCGIWYVSPTGSGTEGTPNAPVSLKYAVINSTPQRNIIRCLAGNYQVDTVLHLQDNMIIEGAYVISAGKWIKKTNAVTQISMSGFESISPEIEHVIGFKADSVSNWKILDLKILTANASGQTPAGLGRSVYGIWARNAQNILISRVKITAGNGSNGADGAPVTGTGGGNPGGSGGSGGSHGNNCSNGNPGTVGGTGTNGTAGGTGGAAGTSGGCNIFNCDKNPADGGNGGNGSDGSDGAGFTPGDRPATPAASGDYFVPLSTAENGSPGNGGGGGGGGGGAARGTCCTCSCGSSGAAGNGGDGGAGGAGGLGGNGGLGGGGSFALYISGNSSGDVNNCELISGNPGLGGNGSDGQPGELGAQGSLGQTGVRCGVNYTGGLGGSGGKGGNGGRGRDGANGLSQGFAAVSPAAISLNGSNVASGTEFGVEFFNAACTRSEINITKFTGTWGLPPGAQFLNNTGPNTSSFTNASNNAIIMFTQTGSYSLTDQTTNASDFIQITQDRPAPVINSIPSAICEGYGINLGTSTTGTEYDWIIYSGTVANIIYSSNLQNPGVSTPLTTQGNYAVRLRVKDACCGWSAPVYQAFTVTSAAACAGIEELFAENILVYPNPVTRQITIQFNKNFAEQPLLTLTDSYGRVIEKRRLPSEQGLLTVPVDQLANGIYYLEIKGAEGVYTQKLIKQ